MLTKHNSKFIRKYSSEQSDGRPDLLNENNGYFIRFKILLKNDHEETAEIELNMLKKSISKYKKLDTFIEI